MMGKSSQKFRKFAHLIEKMNSKDKYLIVNNGEMYFK